MGFAGIHSASGLHIFGRGFRQAIFLPVTGGSQCSEVLLELMRGCGWRFSTPHPPLF
eukprot:jgi/Botrbrau1/4959/Bobra.0122s0034.1